jgi:hypothetical protein
MRHYEILGNYCIPYFVDLEKCPIDTLNRFPKDLLLEARELTKDFESQKYFHILNLCFEYTKKNLTTEALAKYVLSYV